ncbi:hypothetical protein AJ78_02620 [Emergomyces pasteurianus Ep9510]|uniref:TROVE domain-containing protein n=1 Tax=Emergomyces pasteurianus Ep9510 TaxID=1447872 RepID=A0A1J9PMF4_9EURO|nr:hypothetical protein AJ78_02620 [Emergomyces pasteurianus Ep9510]
MDTNIPSSFGEKSPKTEIAEPQQPPPAKKMKTTSMDSSFPVLLPEDPCLRMSDEEFEVHIFKTLPALTGVENAVGSMHIKNRDDSSPANERMTQPETTNNAFVDALDRAAADPDGKKAHDAEMAKKNRMLTTKGGMAFASTQSPLLELFNQVGNEDNQDCTENLLMATLEQAWEVDPLMTLKIIWVTRSIHLGKGEKGLFYRQIGWLGQNHPRTLLRNLKWLYRPVIKKDAKEREGDKQVVVEKVSKGEDGDTMEVDDYDVLQGGSHGYWKDLLNILVLSAEEKLDTSDPDEVMFAYPRRSKKGRPRGRPQRGRRTGGACGKAERVQEKTPKSQAERKEASKAEKVRRYEHTLDRLATDPFHRALHLTVARLFADQLRKDMLLLEDGTKNNNEAALCNISICAKWAPSLERFHDKHTLIASTIAELLFPDSSLDPNNREVYLKRAREQYRAYTLSPLRKALSIVERDISAETFSNIQYSHVPSLAMNQYKNLFNKKDHQRYTDYLEKVANGQAKISGAVLTPGLLVKNVISAPNSVDEVVADLQWKALVQRIKDSGTLSSAIAVCDVSGSMDSPRRQNIAPIHNAVGLSLLMAEVTKPPFGGRIITFSEDPSIHIVEDTSLKNRVTQLQSSDWGFNTDFVKVFRNLVLPLAVENKVPPEDMVKRVFVFSDMQFDEAQVKETDSTDSGKSAEGRNWQTHQQIVAQEFRDHGYEVPELVYWNLAEQAGAVPVTAEMEGTALVSGHSQALMKAFLEDGVFGAEEEEDDQKGGEEKMEVVDGDGDWGLVQEQGKKKKKKIDPMGVLRTVVGHEAFDMLRVVD